MCRIYTCACLYRRLGELTRELKEIDGFGPRWWTVLAMPVEVQNLLKVVFIKSLCRTANVEKLEAGPKGVVLQFRDKQFPNPAGLVAISRNRAAWRRSGRTTACS